MPYITTDNINRINAELTNYCNAACPMCARYYIDGKLVADKVNNKHTTLEFLKEKIGLDVVRRLRHFTSCGNFGDGAMNPECVEIYRWLREVNPNIGLQLHSNGGARNKEFWTAMAEIGVEVTFAIDGMDDTNHLYRRNVKWPKLIENVKAFISAGGKANWEMLVFKHNEKQIESCRKLSESMGFQNFNSKQSSRWADFTSEGEWRDLTEIKLDTHSLEKSTYMEAPGIGQGGNSQKENTGADKFKESKINCYAHQVKKNFVEIYLAANGDVSPCCWLGDLSMHESKNIIQDHKKVNLNHTSLENILAGDYFKQLEKGIRGDANAHRLQTCYFTCGVKDL